MVAESAMPGKPEIPDFERLLLMAPFPAGAFLLVEAAFFAAAYFEPEKNSDWVWLLAGLFFTTGRLCTFTVCSTAAGAVALVDVTVTPPDALME
jgi:hypothetical protein